MAKKLRTLYQSPRDPHFVQNPFAFYKKVQLAGKTVRWDEYDLIVTSDYMAVNYILRNSEFVREPPSGFVSGLPQNLLPFYENESRSILEREPPYHTRIKSILAPFFTKKKLTQVRIEMETLCDDILETITCSKFDLISNFSQKFPVIIIARILGVPELMTTQLVNWSTDMVAMYQARRNEEIEKKAVAATTEFSSYIKSLIQEKKRSPSEDLISYLADIGTTANLINEDEIVSTVILLLNAGHEATVHTISNGLKTVLESRFELIDLIKIPARLSNEILRFATPLHLFTRYFTKEATLFGHQFAPGDKIGLLLAAANRDPDHFKKPEEFDPFIDRKTNVSLGAGLHFCLGAHLARIELEIALVALIKKFPKMQISKAPSYQDNYHFYGLKELLIKT